jgi:UDP-N-acetyl-D-mannosaminuronate dehydrogenase
MVKESVLILGLGEVGQTLFDLFNESGRFDVYGYDIDAEKMRAAKAERKLKKKVDTLHICYPCPDRDKFIKTTIGYIGKFGPGLTIIDSTVPPGTTRRIHQLSGSLVAHSPIQGMHKSLEVMKRDVVFWGKYVGGVTKKAADLARKHFEELGLKVRVLKGPEETELAKLFETIYRAWMIACFQEMHRISTHFNADFDDVVDMIDNIHRRDLNKPLHYPDVIGGHCLIPNTEMLLKSYDSEFLRLILESNQKRKQEIKNAKVRNEVKRIEKRTKALEDYLRKEHGARLST